MPGADWRERSINDTLQDMANAIFCVCPPGITAHTSRFWKALRSGCIPVTFSGGYDLPFSSVIDFASATVNIQPDNIHTLSLVLSEVLDNSAKLMSLRNNVARIQNMIVWETESLDNRLHDGGMQKLLWNELSRRTQNMYTYAALERAPTVAL